MLRRAESAGGSALDSGGQLLKELEALRKALHRNGNPSTVSRSVSAGKSHPKPSPRPAANVKAGDQKENPSVGQKENPSVGQKENPSVVPTEKKSLWSWKPLRALSHVRHRRFICSFSLNVGSIEGLPPSFNGKSICVNWKRKDGGLQTTKPSKVVHGVSNFDETLSQKCCVYGSVAGANQIAKYESKQFVLYATMVGVPDHDLGRHKIDLTRLLPDTFEELGGEKRTGSRTTNFKLSGKAKGAILIVTLEFSVLGDEYNQSSSQPTISKNNVGVTKLQNSTTIPITKSTSLEKFKIASKNAFGSSLGRSGSTPTSNVNSLPRRYSSPSVEEFVNIIHEVPPSVKTVFSVSEATGMEEQESKKLEDSLEDFVKGDEGCELEENEFLVIEKGIEVSSLCYSDDIDLKPVGHELLSSSLCHVVESDTDMMPVGENLLLPSSLFHSAHTDLIAVGEDLMTSNDHTSENPQLDFGAENLQLDVVELGPRIIDREEDVQADQKTSEGFPRFEVNHDNTNEGCLWPEPIIAESASLESRESEKDSETVLKNAGSKNFGVGSCNVEIDLPTVGLQEQENLKHDHESKDVDLFTDESAKGVDFSNDKLSIDMNLITEEIAMKELDTAFGNIASFNADTLDTRLEECLSCCTPPKFCVDPSKNVIGKSNSLDHLTESVANEFLTMLGLEHSPFALSSESDPESPREKLWKQFEKDSMATGCLFGADVWNEEEKSEPKGSPYSEFHVETQTNWEIDEEFELSSIVHVAEAEHEKAVQAMRSKTRAKVLEGLETEVLMQEWGMNERAFQNSPPGDSGRFSVPIDLPPEEPLALPSLGEGLGSLVKTRDGGFVRSMSPALFKNTKNSGSLVMQVSSPVVVPAEMGSGVMDILQSLASLGIEKLSMQAKKLMPLEDITGKSMLQVTHESTPALDGHDESQNLLLHQTTISDNESLVGSAFQDKPRGRRKGANKNTSLSNSSIEDSLSECVSLEELAPFAMDKIEALSIEGLKIQSGMSDDEMLSNVSAQSIGELSALEGTRAKTAGSLGLEGTGGLRLLDLDKNEDPIDGLMGLSITLDEWIKLDAGIVDDEDESGDRTSKVLAAHHAKSTELVTRSKMAEQSSSRNSGKRWGLLGNTLTVALLVQLRDPLRNYEPVGTPMLALIQAERVVVPPKPKVYASVSVKGNSEEVEEPEPLLSEVEKKEEVIPQFKITEVHVAGLKTEVEKKKGWGWGWGSAKQEQSGSRWLLASGMGKSNKNPFMKSKPITKSQPQQQTTTVKPGETLWSISSRVHGTGAKWKDLAALNPHIRNPNIIFPNETIRLS